MKYVLIYIHLSDEHGIYPGTMFEVDRGFLSIEDATERARELRLLKETTLILQYYDITD